VVEGRKDKFIRDWSDNIGFKHHISTFNYKRSLKRNPRTSVDNDKEDEELINLVISK
jgi:hypothetical protein